MTDTQYMTTTGITYRKATADRRYYVDIDGVKVGWVLKDSDGEWSFYATVYESLKGTRLAWGFPTRRDAVIEGLADLRIRHYGRVLILNMDTIRDEVVRIDPDRIHQLEDQLLDAKYGLGADGSRRWAGPA